jgi:Ca-activated chloride channel homolog
MAKRIFTFVCLLSIPLSPGGGRASAQNEALPLHVNVVLVQLSVAITDPKGNYVSGLRPEDFAIYEDNIPEKTATFEEGNELSYPRGKGAASDDSQFAGKAPVTAADTPVARFAGANVFILFDTSNYMYTGFVFAQDAIVDFYPGSLALLPIALRFCVAYEPQWPETMQHSITACC